MTSGIDSKTKTGPCTLGTSAHVNLAGKGQCGDGLRGGGGLGREGQRGEVWEHFQ